MKPYLLISLVYFSQTGLADKLTNKNLGNTYMFIKLIIFMNGKNPHHCILYSPLLHIIKQKSLKWLINV